MKIVVRRHTGHCQVIRACAVAQILASGNQVSVETFAENKPILELFGIQWKDPRAPYAAEKRETNSQTRAGGKVWDFVVDLDGEGPFEPRWLNSKLGLGAWIKSELSKDFPQSAETFEANPFPALLAQPANFWTTGGVLLAPLSRDVDPNEINACDFSDEASKDHPGVAQYWADFGANFGAGRESIRANTPAQLVAAIAGAKAVYAVNGIVAALACCTWNARPIAQELHFIQSVPPKIFGTSNARDFERHRRVLLEVDALPKSQGIHRHRFDFAAIDSSA